MTVLDAADTQRVGALLEEVTPPTHEYLVLFVPDPDGLAAGTDVEALSRITTKSMPDLLRQIADNLEENGISWEHSVEEPH